MKTPLPAFREGLGVGLFLIAMKKSHPRPLPEGVEGS
ncbi:hypothetical protein FHS49_003033 [Sphingobium boeckii]|uniref:Uncharacterized protein n=1 Tax=Sphingobium boeckii TaxID=1082345 RepID=A0A7W9EGD7_9SPHN|nr:hypothetical protein [Sphingobium boeckii]